jgi:DNA-binding NarL/FixJ family response regulator
MGKLGVLIVDDHAVVRSGLRAILNNDPRLEVVGEAADGMDACLQAATLHPPVVIMDVSMPTLNGADATRKLLTVSPASSVIALPAYDEPAYVRELLDAGARGYVLKRSVIEQLVRAIEVVTEGGLFLDPTLTKRPAPHAPADAAVPSAELTSREIEVASMTALGHSNAEIGAALKIAVKTVETHKTRLTAKLGLHTRAQLVRFAIYRGWLVSR